MAFDREEEHLYRFIFKWKISEPNELQAFWRDRGMLVPLRGNQQKKLYINCPDCLGGSCWAEEKDAAKTELGTMDLKIKQKFEYLFDFGDEWWHEIEVMEILPVSPGMTYPTISKVQGESPSQYDYGDDDE